MPGAGDLKYFKKLGRSLPSLGMGTWGIGGGYWSPDTSGDAEWVSALRRGLELGMTLIDTAEMYGGGHSEEVVGEAVKGFDRDEVFIVSKVWPTHARRDDVVKAAEASVRRLGTFMDLYLIHWPPAEVPLCETMRGLEEVVRRGLARFIGVSNFGLELIEEARACLSREDVAAVENKFSLLDRRDESSVVPYAEREGMLYLAYTPLEKGQLARDSFLAEVGRKYGKTAAQVALNWLIKLNPVVPIPKASSLAHVEENAGAMGWRLSDEDWRAISKRFSELKA
ncbi:aldo/keto reductase [Thermofilum pendens]|uniref:Aldo/keto reductase n=1 Tax=Thermofilum pendens (strain DSM 2475 / Hrk 5) TaxID=368408 RepID=A1RYR4_THEPD|nr:aldo/keto reductase [Thermofilum pendens]ABL78344.1 aldo/keto reductase [Thermofilum pendens Hrk 5]